MTDSHPLLINTNDIKCLDIKLETDYWPLARKFLKKYLDDDKIKVVHAELVGDMSEEDFFGFVSLYDTSMKYLDVIFNSPLSSINLELIAQRWREVDVVYKD